MNRVKPLNRHAIYENSCLQFMQCHTAILPMNREATAKAIKLLRTSAWFGVLRFRLHASSAYEIGKRLQPGNYNRVYQDGSYHHNLWVKYAKGENNPGPKTVKTAAEKVPDSLVIFQHPLWKALDLTTPLGKQADAMIRSLHTSAQRAVFDPFKLKLHVYKRRSTLHRSLTLLENNASIDALCTMIILLREAHDEGRSEDAFAVGHSLFRILIMTSVMSDLSGLCTPFLVYLQKVVFPLATHDGIEFDFRPDHLMHLAFLFNRTALQMEDLEKIRVVNGGPTHDWRKIITGGFGFDHLYGFQPIYKLAPAKQSPTRDTQRIVRRHEIARQWAYQVLSEYRAEPLMPEEISKKMANA